MRAIFALLVAAVALAGCADEEPSRPTSPTTTTPDPTPSPSPSPTPSPTPTPTPTTPDAAPPTREVLNSTFDFGSGQAAGPDGKQEPFTVPEGYATLRLNVTLTPRQVGSLPGSSLTVQLKVTVLDPAGKSAFSTSETGSQEVELEAVPGAWTLRYDGTGNVDATVLGVVEP